MGMVAHRHVAHRHGFRHGFRGFRVWMAALVRWMVWSSMASGGVLGAQHNQRLVQGMPTEVDNRTLNMVG